jgi:hypothetical protein
MGEATAINTGETAAQQEWRAHPAREHAGRALAGAALIAAVAAAVLATVLLDGGGLGGALAWSGGAAALLVLSTHRFYLPSRYAIDDEGITAISWLGRRHLRWADLRRFTCDANGGYLSTRARPSRLDAFKGMHVLFGDQRDEVVAAIRAHLGQGGDSWAR